MSHQVNVALNGALGALALVAALFFHRFWRGTRDRFFLLFALAFVALSINWFGLSMRASADEPHTPLYLTRLVALLLIIAAVIGKNRGRR